MSNVLRLAVVDPDDASRETLKTMLLGMEMIWLEAECSRYEFFSDVVDQTSPDVGIIAVDDNPTKALDLVARLAESAPDCAVLVVSESNDGDLILQAMRAGAKEFLPKPIRIEDLLAALGRISERRFGRNGGTKSRACQVVAVAGVVGGVGTTSISVNMGCEIALNEEYSVALVDLDLCLGDADVFLDTIPEYTLVDVAQNVSRLDYALLKRSLTRHSSGLYLLPRPMQMEDIPLVTAEDFRRVVGLLKATFTHLVLDLSKSYGSVDQIAMEMADEILLVTQLDLPCLRNVVRLLASFEEIEGMVDKVKIMVNRDGRSDGQISVKKAQDTIGHEIFWRLPNDYRTMSEVRNNGVPLLTQAPKAALTQSYRAMVDALSGDTPTEAADGAKKSGIGRLFNGLLSSGKKA